MFPLINLLKLQKKNKDKYPPHLCLSCGEKIKTMVKLKLHHDKNTTHNIFMVLTNLTIACYECNKLYENNPEINNSSCITQEDKEKLKLHIQYYFYWTFRY